METHYFVAPDSALVKPSVKLKKKIQYSTVKFPKHTQTVSNTGRTNESWRRRGHKIQQLHPIAYRLGLYYGDVDIRVYETHGAFLVKRWVVS